MPETQAQDAAPVQQCAGGPSEPGLQGGHRGTRAIQRMVEYAPSTGGLALWVLHHDVEGDVESAPHIATDGRTIHYGAAFASLTLAQQVGLVAHEVLHIALRHVQRHRDLQQLLGEVDLQLFNICADAVVNSTLGHLAWLQLPTGHVRLEQLLAGIVDGTQPVDRLLLEWDVERLYRAIDDRQPAARGGSQQRDRGTGTAAQRAGGQAGGGRADSAQARQPQDTQHAEQAAAQPQVAERDDGPRSARARALGGDAGCDLCPAADAREAPELEAEQARAWSERIVRAHAGDGAHSMLRALIADLPAVRTPWEHVLRRQLARGLAPLPSLTWSRPSRSYLANQGRCGAHRRMPFEPGHSASKAVPRLVVVADISGSIDAALMTRFAREVEAIARRAGAGLVLIVGDDRVRRVEHFAPGRVRLGEITFEGGGGTDFTPLLTEAAAHRPDITVVLTDLDGPARFRPPCPVLWAVTAAHALAVPPFGRTLVLR